MVLKLACLAIATGTVHAVFATPPVKSVTGGLVAGLYSPNGNVSVFLGIPFAAPPTGNRRWQAPAPIIPWTGVRNATVYGPMCTQFMPLVPQGSEDCLVLNVFAPPATAGTTLPVLVWIHGGGMVMGSAQTDLVDYAVATRAVVVAVQYRLGLFGFGYPRAADDGGATTANAGVLDWISGLEWVRDNAAAFGGDPARVTVSGQSAGGMNMLYLLTIPRAFGLYRSIISQSPGTPTWNATKARALADGIGTRVGCPSTPPADQLACLVKADAGALVEAAAPISLFLPIALGPSIDGRVITTSPRTAFAAGAFNRDPNVTVLVWSTGAEGDGFMLAFMELAAGCLGAECFPASQAMFNATMQAFWGGAHAYPPPVVEAISSHYATLATGPGGWFGAVSASFSEGTIGCSVRGVARASGLRVYRALVNESVPELGFANQPLGVASHSTDTALLFNGTLDAGVFPAPARVPFSAPERTVISSMWGYVGNTLATGDPNSGPFGVPGGISWPRYDPTGGVNTTLVWSHAAPGRLIAEYAEAACDGFWGGIYI